MVIELLFLVLIIHTGSSSRSDANSTWWPCTPLTAETNFNLNQITGQWYLQETISSIPGNPATCAGLEFVHGNEWPSSMTMIGQEMSHRGSIHYENHTILIPDPANHPGLWDQPDIGGALMVLDVGPNNKTLALTTCHRFLGYDWTGVFSRDTRIDSTILSQTNERLQSLGLQNTEMAVILNTTNCFTANNSNK